MRTTTMLTVFAIVASVGGAASQMKAQIRYRPTLVVQIPVGSLDKSITFYTEVLGYTLTERRDDLQFAHIATNVPGVEIGLNVVAKPNGSGGVILNIGVADVAEARKTLEARGVVFDGATIIIPGKVALAGFKDLDGNSLRFAGPPPPKSAHDRIAAQLAQPDPCDDDGWQDEPDQAHADPSGDVAGRLLVEREARDVGEGRERDPLEDERCEVRAPSTMEAVDLRHEPPMTRDAGAGDVVEGVLQQDGR